MELKDYYAILGVAPNSTHEEMKRAYRKLTRKYHPDVSKLADAENKFKEINEAWEVLGDEKKKQQYDQLLKGKGQPSSNEGFSQGYGNDFYSGDHPEDFIYTSGGDFSEFFKSMFEGAVKHPSPQTDPHVKRKGQDLHTKVTIPLTLAYEGGVQSLSLQVPTDTPGHSATKNLQVNIPAGVKQHSQIRLKGQGRMGSHGAPAGDLYIEIEIQPHPYFSLVGKDVYLQLPITPWEAALGANVEVPTLGGKVNLKIAPNAQNGQKLRLKGRGFPGHPPGDQYVVLSIMTPKADSEKAVEMYQQMAKMMPFNPREKLGV